MIASGIITASTISTTAHHSKLPSPPSSRSVSCGRLSSSLSRKLIGLDSLVTMEKLVFLGSACTQAPKSIAVASHGELIKKCGMTTEPSRAGSFSRGYYHKMSVKYPVPK